MSQEKKLSRNQWIRNLITEGLSEEKILELMRKGDLEKGLKPVEPPFDKLVYKRVKKKM